MKKYILGLAFAIMVPFAIAHAATPVLTVTGHDDNNNVTVRVTDGEINAPVELFYNSIVGEVAERRTLGTTDINGDFTGVVSTTGLGISQMSPVYVQVGGFQSLSVNWPFDTGTSTGGPVTGSSGSPTVSAGIVNLIQGGQVSITLSGGTAPYTVSTIGGSGVSTTLIGNTLYINGSIAGMTTLNVCSTSTTATSLACTPVTVIVQAQSQTPSMGALSFTLPLTSGEPLRLSLSGGSGSYFVQSSGTTPVTANVNGNLLTLVGSAIGSTIVNVCSTGTSGMPTTCLPISIAVGPSLSGTGGGFLFDTNLSMGMSGLDVLELQNRLRDEGYFNVTPTGYYGPITEASVRVYQAANGLPSVGVVGPLTRALLNQ